MKKIKIGGQSETIFTWIWNVFIWICIIAAIITLLSSCQSESGRRARLARMEVKTGTDTVLLYTSPAGDKLYKFQHSNDYPVWLVQNCHGEITAIVRQ